MCVCVCVCVCVCFVCVCVCVCCVRVFGGFDGGESTFTLGVQHQKCMS